MSPPRISVVTPSFNQGRFLEQCITSVLNQDYPDLEYIVIDGGSSDESVDVLRRYEKHFAFWVSEPDKGQSDALNKGFRRATGDLAVWLNADDFFLPGAFAAVAAAYQQNPDASFYFGDGCARRRERQSHQPDVSRTRRPLEAGRLALRPRLHSSTGDIH